MPAYVLFSRYSTAGFRRIREEPEALFEIRQVLEQWEAKILHEYHVLGPFDHCTIFEVSDNFRAHRAALQLELTDAGAKALFPAIDIPLFERMVRQEIRTEGPHEWQIKPWARATRLLFRWYHWDRWINQYFDPFIVTGRDHFKSFDGPCIVVANHTSHFDSFALFGSLPIRVQSNIYFGAAADRWFLKDGGGRKELALQPWYNSLIGGSFPIRRGGGSQTLAYSKWLLDNGANLAIFPEGTRSTSKNLSRFKHGVSLLATEKRVPVVPVYLTGIAKIKPKGSRDIKPGPVHAHIQPPVHLPDGIAIPDATRMIYDAVNIPHQRVLEGGPEAGRADA